MTNVKTLHSKPEEPKKETLTKAAPAEPEKPKPQPAARSETVNERLLRILKGSRERLRGRGMPELDVELDALIAEVEKW